MVKLTPYEKTEGLMCKNLNKKLSQKVYFFKSSFSPPNLKKDKKESANILYHLQQQQQQQQKQQQQQQQQHRGQSYKPEVNPANLKVNFRNSKINKTQVQIIA